MPSGSAGVMVQLTPKGAGGTADQSEPLIPASEVEGVPLKEAGKKAGGSGSAGAAPDQQKRRYIKQTGNSPYARLFAYDRNRDFGFCAELAARGAFFLYLAAVPKIFGLDQHIEFLRHETMFSSASIVMFIYTLYKSVGDTLSFAWDGLMGTFLAEVMAILMYGFFPKGVTSTEMLDPTFMIGAAAGSVFIVLTLWLNMATLTQIFVLSNFVWHWMAFMDPNQHDGYSAGFRIDPNGVGMEGLKAAFWGSALAIICTLLPYPIFALNTARDTAQDIVEELNKTWRVAIEFYCSESPNRRKVARMKQEMQVMQGTIGSLSGYLESAWWETRLTPKWRRARLMLLRLDTVANECHDRLRHVIHCCMNEGFEERHKKVVRQCRPVIEQIVSYAHKLLELSTDAACDGGVNQDEEVRMERDMKKIRELMEELVKTFRSAKAEVGLPHISEELLDEHVFCLSVCYFGRVCCDYADALIQHARAERGEPDAERLPRRPQDMPGFGFLIDRTVLFNRDHLNFVLRNAMAIIIGWCIGYKGYSSEIGQYSAGISSTASVLLSKFAGSALTKNLGRMQGVVLGCVVGELVYALFGWCEAWAYWVMSALLLIWATTTLYVYYSSATYGYIACLMAAFGTQKFLTGCSSDVVNPADSYSAVIEVVVATMVMMGIDLAFAVGRPSEMAYSNYAAAWSTMEQLLEQLFDPDKEETAVHKGDIVARISKAEALGVEANSEARLWRSPWPTRIFDTATRCAYEVRLNMSCMDYAVTDRDPGTAMKEKWFLDLSKLRSCQTLRDAVKGKMDQIALLLKIHLSDEDTEADRKSELLQVQFYMQVQQAMKEFIAEGNKEVLHKSMGIHSSLEDDSAARISFLLSCISSLMSGMWELHSEILE